MIETHELTKRYGTLTAVDSISFQVGSGEVLGFIGPNGAGKTTTMRILTGFLPATQGKAIVAGHDVFENPMEVKRTVGYLPETPPLYRELTVGQYLRFVAEIREVPRALRLRRIGEVMEQVGLSGWESRIVGSLSKGYRQRVGLAQALLHDPKVLILDEPTSGLDPGQTQGVRRLIEGLAGDRTVILSTHILREVEALCSRVVVINRSKLVADGTLAEVCAHAGPTTYRVEYVLGNTETPWGRRLPSPSEVAVAIGGLREVDQVRPLADGGLEVSASEDPRSAIASFSAQQGWVLARLEAQAPGLEQAFLSLVEEGAS
ncbi:MAG: ATP-binding cassette domain-containing protein [Myxococcota bacterium]|nr:ATP-binding cassette domain-containing protein [Myxococcota bacterium]